MSPLRGQSAQRSNDLHRTSLLEGPPAMLRTLPLPHDPFRTYANHIPTMAGGPPRSQAALVYLGHVSGERGLPEARGTLPASPPLPPAAWMLLLWFGCGRCPNGKAAGSWGCCMRPRAVTWTGVFPSLGSPVSASCLPAASRCPPYRPPWMRPPWRSPQVVGSASPSCPCVMGVCVVHAQWE